MEGEREEGPRARDFPRGEKILLRKLQYGYGYKWLGTNIARVIAKLDAIIASSFGTSKPRPLS